MKTFPEPFRYYDLARHWTRRIIPHLGDEELNAILVRDFNRFTMGTWRTPFTRGMLPVNVESCDWRWRYRRPHPRYWAYVKHAACYWIANFSLRLANLSEPNRPWRILRSDEHATVWDGELTLFDFNYQAMGIGPALCFYTAADRELRVGKYMRTFRPPHYTVQREIKEVTR